MSTTVSHPDMYGHRNFLFAILSCRVLETGKVRQCELYGIAGDLDCALSRNAQ
jgi:hypothetical protein